MDEQNDDFAAQIAARLARWPERQERMEQEARARLAGDEQARAAFNVMVHSMLRPTMEEFKRVVEQQGALSCTVETVKDHWAELRLEPAGGNIVGRLRVTRSGPTTYRLANWIERHGMRAGGEDTSGYANATRQMFQLQLLSLLDNVMRPGKTLL